ncbi:MAG: DUF1295 domain-containing protein [Rhodopseudomonas palustris]|nr:DUF1295 domain-containing protein [Rhodopseudomonas palustris]
MLLIAAALCALMAGAWVVQQRTGNSGWVDTIWTFSVGTVGAVAALWPLADDAPHARQWLVAVLALGLGAATRHALAQRSKVAGDDPRYAAYAQQWGLPRRRGACSSFYNSRRSAAFRWCSRFSSPRQFPSAELRWQDIAGFAILAIGIAGEAIADRQLRQLPQRSGQSRPGVRSRPVALVAAPELLL